jgi:hypothetical protein
MTDKGSKGPTGLRGPLRVAAAVLALLGLGFLAKAQGTSLAVVMFLLCAAALFASWAVAAPSPREREGMLDDSLDEVRRRATQTEEQRLLRRRRLGRRWFDPD